MRWLLQRLPHVACESTATASCSLLAVGFSSLRSGFGGRLIDLPGTFAALASEAGLALEVRAMSTSSTARAAGSSSRAAQLLPDGRGALRPSSRMLLIAREGARSLSSV